jgi:hypothetical protein
MAERKRLQSKYHVWIDNEKKLAKIAATQGLNIGRMLNVALAQWLQEHYPDVTGDEETTPDHPISNFNAFEDGEDQE